MLLTIGVILLICWALGFLAFHVAGGLIHRLPGRVVALDERPDLPRVVAAIVLAVISFIAHLFTGRRTVA